MCGIIGYVGQGETVEIIMSGLRHLEYRGYDSAGVAVHDHDGISALKTEGNLDHLELALEEFTARGSTGIGHTRWATHGAPSERNAHPHLDCREEIAVVHNGIIENFRELKAELTGRGHTFLSDTDSEVLAHLIEEHLEGDLFAAVQKALREVRGAFALACFSTREPGTLVGARTESPLVIGLGEGEMFLSSALPAFLTSTRRAIFLEDGDVVRMTADGYHIETLAGKSVARDIMELELDISSAEKGGYPDFMLKEIFEQPAAWRDTLRGARDAKGALCLPDLNIPASELCGVRRVSFVACGTAYHAALIGRYILENWTNIPTEIDIASEFRYRQPKIGPDTLVVAVSQSGETLDTLGAVRGAREAGARVVCIVNTVGSLLTRESDGVIYTHAGPEIGVAATKTFLAQIAGVYLLALHLGRVCGDHDEAFVHKTLETLEGIPALLGEVLADTAAVQECARLYYECEDFLFLGRHINYPVAMEGALKLKEISYVHAEGYPAGEMKHGPIALLHPGFPVMALAPRDWVYDKMTNNVQEIKARRAPVIAVATRGDVEIAELADQVLYVPETEPVFYPAIVSPVLQLFAYYIAKLRGCNVDQPRNLAKTVTVE